MIEEQMPDILHITCHGDIGDETSGFVWTLDDTATGAQYKLTQDDIHFFDMEFAAAQPLIFGNACASAMAGDVREGRRLSTFGFEFYRSGASAFIGTFAPITKTLAVAFARVFYQKLLAEKQPVGEALRATKQQFSEQGDHDPSWLFYCLYGPSETQYQIVSP
jgi:CHAT domain-containing protein